MFNPHQNSNYFYLHLVNWGIRILNQLNNLSKATELRNGKITSTPIAQAPKLYESVGF